MGALSFEGQLAGNTEALWWMAGSKADGRNKASAKPQGGEAGEMSTLGIKGLI